MPSVITPCGGASGIVFDKSPQTGGFLEITTLTGSITIEDTSGNGLSLTSNDGSGGGGFVQISTDDGEVIIASTSIVNRLPFGGASSFEVQYPGASSYLLLPDTGFATLSLKTGAAFKVDDDLGNMRVEISADGNVAMPNLPTLDPGIPGRLWNDLGTVKISL